MNPRAALLAAMARPRVLEPHDAISLAAARARGLLWKQLAYRMGVSMRTLYRTMARHEAEAAAQEGAPADAPPAGADEDQAAAAAFNDRSSSKL